MYITMQLLCGSAQLAGTPACTWLAHALCACFTARPRCSLYVYVRVQVFIMWSIV